MANPDISLLAAFLKKDVYTLYREYIDVRILDPEIYKFLTYIDDYFKEVGIADTTPKEFVVWFKHAGPYSSVDENRQELYDHFLNEFEHIEVSETLMNMLVKHYQDLHTKKKLLESIDTTIDADELKEILQEHEKKSKKEDKWKEFVLDNDIRRLVANNDRSKGLKFRLDILNDCVGGLLKGDFMLIFAYVDVGKSALAVSESVYIASNLKEGKVLYLNNEERDDRQYAKFWPSALGRPWKEIEQNLELAEAAYIKKMHGDKNRIQLVNAREIDIKILRKMCEYYKPSLLVIDQIDNIRSSGGKNMQERTRLKQLYTDVRALANDFCPIIGLSQADASTRWLNKDTQEVQYKMFIDFSQLDESKIGKPGAVDFTVGVGMDKRYPNMRGISLGKMKTLCYNGLNTRQIVKYRGDVVRYENPDKQ